MTIAPRPNRRRFLAAVIATASAAVLVACGSTTTDAAGGPDTRVVQHAMGESTVPVAPKRVVVIDSPHLDALVALGITPVGATVSAANDGFPGYLRDQLGGTTSVGSTTSPNVEAIAALRPDLIIGSKVRHEKLYAQLSGIAPTVFSEDSGTNWKEQATVTAAAVNRTDEMAAKLAALDARAVAVGKQVGAPGTTLSIVRFRATAFRLYGPETFSGSVITAMGFTIPQKAWNEYSMVELSPERFDEINGDTVFHTRGAGADPTAETVTTRWGALPAVAAGRAFAVEDETWMVGIGVIGAGRIIDDVQRLVKPVARP